MPKKQNKTEIAKRDGGYGDVLSSMVQLLEESRRTSARAVNSIMTATYWEIGRRIVEIEQGGEGRAEYGKELIKRLSDDLTGRFGRGFSEMNLRQMRRFFAAWPLGRIQQTLSVESTESTESSSNRQTASVESESEISPTLSAKLQVVESNGLTAIQAIATVFRLPWSHYVKLLSVDDEKARKFYEDETLRGGWSVRQLDRQIGSKFYERTLLSKNKVAMLEKGKEPQSGDLMTPEEQIKDPFVLEFLDLKDEYSEHDLEDALIHKLEDFLLELGSDFTFVGRQKRLRIGDEWYRIDLLFFHRRLRCLVVIDLKLGKFTHADAGQMHMYLNYAAEHWTHDGENPPVGLILCADKDAAVAHYSLEGLPNKVMASEYKLALPDEKLLEEELQKTKHAIESRKLKTEN